jgi:hypothetical protein
MRKSTLSILVALAISCSILAQTVDVKPKMVFEGMYILPKRGMEDKFEAAIKAHNAKFHPEGPNVAGLRKVEFGEMANWYVWVHGPAAYASLDAPPTKESGHQTDWDTNVEPLIDKYGDTYLYERNDDLSYGLDLVAKAKHVEIWNIKLKPGEYKKFTTLCEKVKKTYESIGTEPFIVMNNVVHQANKADVALIWTFNSYEKWGNDPGPKAAYEKLFGVGSWQTMMEDWNSIIVDYTSEIRTFLR